MIQTNPITKTNSTIVTSSDTGKSNTSAAKGTVSTNSTANKQTFCDYRAKVGETIYSLSEGQILSVPWRPYARLSTKRLSEVRFLIHDPTATEYSRISENDDVRVEIGFSDNSINKFVGKIKIKGRVEPGATFVVAVDNLATLSQSMGSSVINAGDPVQHLITKTVSESGRKIVATNTGVLARISRQDGDKTARGTIYQSSVAILAHSKLAFDTDVRIECLKTRKQVTIKVNDRPPSASGFAGSPQLLKDLGILDLTAGECRFEVLAPPGAETAPIADANKASKTEGIPDAQRTASELNPGQKFKYAQRTNYDADKPGSATLQQSPGKALVANAASRGDSIIVSGNTVIEVSANQSQQESTGLVLNYATQRDAFKGDPIFSKRSPLELTSGTGTITVQGWNSNTKESISATVASPGAPDLTGGLKIFPSPTGPIEVSKPIYPGSQYNWGDATKEGRRIPRDKTIFQNIIEIAQIVDKYTIEVNKGKWTINSWYRDPVANSVGGGVSGSSHLEGLAVDAIFEGFRDLHQKLYSAYPYGLAIQPSRNGFIHLDARKGGKRRWTYPTKKR